MPTDCVIFLDPWIRCCFWQPVCKANLHMVAWLLTVASELRSSYLGAIGYCLYHEVQNSFGCKGDKMATHSERRSSYDFGLLAPDFKAAQPWIPTFVTSFQEQSFLNRNCLATTAGIDFPCRKTQDLVGTAVYNCFFYISRWQEWSLAFRRQNFGPVPADAGFADFIGDFHLSAVAKWAFQGTGCTGFVAPQEKMCNESLQLYSPGRA